MNAGPQRSPPTNSNFTVHFKDACGGGGEKPTGRGFLQAVTPREFKAERMDELVSTQLSFW